MKRKIIIKDFDGKIKTLESTIRDEDHFRAQQKFRATIVKPKKGKGSFKRNKRVEVEY